jgi:HEAT repeat protein/PBS lyase HEAT-like repeat-containing protein
MKDQHRTSNTERRTSNGRARGLCSCLWALCVLCGGLLPSAHAADNDVKTRRAVHLLIRGLVEKDPPEWPKKSPPKWRKAEAELLKMGDKALPDLLLAVDNRHVAVTTMAADKNELARSRVARIAGKLGGARAGKHLVAALSDKSALIQCSAAQALGAMSHKSAVPELVKLTRGRNSLVVTTTVFALGRIGDRAAVKDLVALLKDRAGLAERYKDPVAADQVRAAAAFALGGAKDRSSVPALLAALSDESQGVRRSADLALRRLSGKNAGFRASAPERERNKAIRAWKRLWRNK